MIRSLIPICLGLIASISSAQNPIDPSNFFTALEIKSSNTAINETYLSQDEKDIFLYNNLARMYPKKFYNLYKAFVMADSYKASLLTSNYYYKTLSDDLLNRAPGGPLMPDKVMFELAECWALESGAKGIVGHDRITCKGGFSGENCSYGYSGGLDIVMQLLIDFSVESLGHRKNMLNPSYKGLGTAIREHSGYRNCAVQDFSWTNDQLRAAAEIERQEREAQQAELNRKLGLRALEFDAMLAKWTPEEMKNADACRSLTYLSDLEKEFYLYANLIRLYPKKFKEVLWDQGPYFDQLLVDLKVELHQEGGYLMVSNYLKTATTKPAFIPTQMMIEKSRCVSQGFARGENNLTSCLKGGGSWQIQSYYPEDNYRDTMTFLMDSKTFLGFFNQNMTVGLDEGMRVLLK